ncbi:hypothetical protein AVEN_79357-1 [Araneus ventricosus]|uniref:Uncharacterized protein n=1 Tax=Araneus ventricosus TaxID=182803 RepID=A0A4Y2UT84_ARAVE|nr:hypothetical protein AVEN_79357-1 [Araneus ventricosus]
MAVKPEQLRGGWGHDCRCQILTQLLDRKTPKIRTRFPSLFYEVQNSPYSFTTVSRGEHSRWLSIHERIQFIFQFPGHSFRWVDHGTAPTVNPSPTVFPSPRATIVYPSFPFTFSAVKPEKLRGVWWHVTNIVDVTF